MLGIPPDTSILLILRKLVAFIFVALSLGTHKIPKVKICLYHMQNSGKQNKTEFFFFSFLFGEKYKSMLG